MNKMTFGNKLFLSIGSLGLFLLVLTGIGLYGIAELDRRLEDALGTQAKKLQIMGDLDTQGEAWLANQRAMIMRTLLKEDTAAKEAKRQIEEDARDVEKAMNELQPLLQTEAAKQSLEKIRNMDKELLREQPQFFELMAAQKVSEAVAFQTGKMRPLFETMNAESASLLKAQNALMKELEQQAGSRAAMCRALIIGAGVVAIVVCLIVVWIVRTANGQLRRVAAEIAQGAAQVASAAGQVSSASQTLAQGSSEQAASLEETSASTEEINSMTQKNAENSRMASEETSTADQLLKETNGKLGQMIESMREINLSSEKISKIIKVIDEIAFQTNILALNAAVEAARAGEAGMGFAVVADEVRNLAQRCAQAAKDTSQLIEESIGRSNEGKVRLDEVAGCITRVVENASRIRILANEVHVGSQEQTRGIEQIAKAISQMQQVTQSSAASAEEGASAGEEMSSQAAHLNDSAARLHEMVGSDEPAERSHATPLKPVLSMAGASKLSNSLKKVVAKPGGTKPAHGKSAHDPFPLDDDFKDF